MAARLAGLLLWVGLCCGGAAAAASPPLTLFGAAGSFGTQVPTPDLKPVAVDGWGLNPGQAAYFSAVTADGTVFVANLPQTFNPLLPTACDMVVTCFNPDLPVCDNGTGAGAFFANIRVPRGDGSFSAPGDCPISTRFGAGALGADISDLEVIDDPDPAAGERVVFTSTWGSNSRPDGFPAWGALRKHDGVWRLDLDSRRWPSDLRQSSEAGAQACRANAPGTASCGSFAEMEELPRSKRIVVAQYAPPGIMVMDRDGTVLATHQWGEIPDACNVGELLIVSPREIDVDPTSASNDERFVVIFDTSDPRGQPIQEFSYDDTARTLVATSAAVAPQTARYPAPRCGEAGQGLLGQYDTHGNLWVGRSASNFVGPINVFLRDAPTGRRARLEGGCSATDPASGEARSWAFPCTADLDVAPAATQAGSVGWLHPWAVNMVEDEATGAMFVVGSNGAVGVIERTPSRHGVTFTSRSMRSLGIDRLPPLQPDEFLRMPSKGIVDVQRRALWVPVTTAEVIDPAGCDFWSCNPVTGKRRSHYLYRVDLEQTIGSAPHAQYARAPSSVRVGKGFSIRVTTTYAEPLDRANSDLSLYEQDSATPLVRIPWRRACNRRGSCSYRAKVPASATAAMADQTLSWHAVVCEESGRNSLHTTGVISVVQ